MLGQISEGKLIELQACIMLLLVTKTLNDEFRFTAGRHLARFPTTIGRTCEVIYGRAIYSTGALAKSSGCVGIKLVIHCNEPRTRLACVARSGAGSASP